MKKFVVFFIVLTLAFYFLLADETKKADQVKITDQNPNTIQIEKVSEPKPIRQGRATATIGAGASTSSAYDTATTPYGTYYEDGQNQILFTAAELSGAGISSGDIISGIGWNVASGGGICNNFYIGLKHTTATSVTAWETGFTQCYTGTPNPAAGWNDYTFSTNFTWNGTDNLLVKVCFDNSSWGSNSTVQYDVVTGMNGWAYNDGTAGCSDPYEGTTDNRPQTRFEYASPSVPILSVTPSPFDFGNIVVGNCSSDQTFTLSNIGTGTITIQSGDISITGADAAQFTLTDVNTYPINLPPNAYVDVKFCPSSRGAKTAYLTIVDDRATTNVTLTGFGRTPPANDDCTNPVAITSFPATGSGTCLDAFPYCPALLPDWEDVWYEITLPYAWNVVDIEVCGITEDISNLGIILMDDCNCDDYIVRDGGLGWVTCPSTYQGYDMSWSAIPGPGTILWPAYIEDAAGEGMAFTYTIDVTDAGLPGTQIWCDNFETDLGWTLVTEFERGAPGGLGGDHGNPDPTSAYQGSNVLGVDLTGLGTNLGDYEASLTDRQYTATSPVINCALYENVHIFFQRWLNVESPTYDHAYIDVNNGTGWVEVWTNSAGIEDAAWSFQYLDISAYADLQSAVQIRFCMGETDTSWFYSGWNLDEVCLWGDPPVPVILSNFTAEYAAGNLALYWTTQSEINNMGWNIYRGESDTSYQNDETIQINPTIIPGAGTTTEPTDYEYLDEYEVVETHTYFYWIESVDNSGVTDIHGPISLTIPEQGEDPDPESQEYYGLYQNVPNPLSNTTSIGFNLKEAANCELTIYNTRGQVVRTFAKNNVANDNFIWDGKDETGKEVKSGIYFYKLNAGDETFIKKMILTR